MVPTPTLAAVAALGCAIAGPAVADVVPVEPFEGDFSDGFDSYFAGFYPELEMFFDDPSSGAEFLCGLLAS